MELELVPKGVVGLNGDGSASSIKQALNCLKQIGKSVDSTAKSFASRSETKLSFLLLSLGSWKR